MASQPACFHRLEEIFTALRAMTSAHLDLGMAVVIVAPVSRTLTSPRLLLWTSTA